MTTQTVAADRVRTRNEFHIERPDTRTPFTTHVRAVLKLSEERWAHLRETLGQQRPEDGN